MPRIVDVAPLVIVAVSRKATTSAGARAAITADELRSMRAHDTVILGVTGQPIYTSILSFNEDAAFRDRSASKRD